MDKRTLAFGLLALTACSSSTADHGAGTSAGDGGGSPGVTTNADASTPTAISEPDAAGGGDDGSEIGDGGVASAPDSGPAAGFTVANVALPTGFTRVISDRFGTGPGETVTSYAELHAKYYEAQFFDRTPDGGVMIPNTVINMEQETYVHFEQAIVFSADHLTIQARGQMDGSITSGEMVSIHTARSFCVEGKYKVAATDKAWPALWWYGSTSGGDESEIDIEQPNTPWQAVHDVSMANHPYSYDTIDVLDSKFTSSGMQWANPAFDGSAAPHTYTMCYDDPAAKLERYIDGQPIYSASWKWNKSLGGTGFGPDATTIFNMAVGGNWPGNTADPTHYTADLDLYYLDYYEVASTK